MPPPSASTAAADFLSSWPERMHALALAHMHLAAVLVATARRASPDLLPYLHSLYYEPGLDGGNAAGAVLASYLRNCVAMGGARRGEAPMRALAALLDLARFAPGPAVNVAVALRPAAPVRP
jgi:hypothetical protein